MDALPRPPQKMRRPTSNRHIPAEIVEKILFNLPVKSLLRFSAVSKSWNSTISESAFVKRYRGGERMAFIRRSISGDEAASTCHVSSISPNNPFVDGAADFVYTLGNLEKLQHDEYKVVAVCDELWLVCAGKRTLSLYLWNPSMRTHKKLPNPPYKNKRRRWADRYVYGLGYESVGDDYKVLMISYYSYYNVRYYMISADLYSLRSDSWRNVYWSDLWRSKDSLHSLIQNTSIEDLPSDSYECVGSSGVSVGGKLHWLSSDYSTSVSIMCFDLWMEKFGEVPIRRFSIREEHIRESISVLRGMLCVSIDHHRKPHDPWYDPLAELCDIWVMEEYGVVESWTKKFSIQRFNTLSSFMLPLYFNEKGEILVRIDDRIYLYKDEKSRPVEVGRNIACAILYVDSLVSPALYCGHQQINH